jgi:hypothetical protein
MKCIECQVNEAEENSALCVHCDREEWQDACRRGNARFQYAERQLSELHSANAAYAARHAANAAYDELNELLEEMIEEIGE